MIVIVITGLFLKTLYQQYFEETIRTGNYYYLSENEIVKEGRIFKINDIFIYSYI